MNRLLSLLEDLPDAAAAAYDGEAGCDDYRDACKFLCRDIDDVLYERPSLLALLDGGEERSRTIACAALAALGWCAWDRFFQIGSLQVLELREWLPQCLPSLCAIASAGSAGERASALAALAKIPWPEPAADGAEAMVCRAALRDDDGAVRAAAIAALCARLGPAAEAFVAPLVEDDNAEVEEQFIDGLLALESRVVAPALLRRARRKVDDLTLSRLRYVGVPEAREMLLEILDSSTERDMRYAAGWALLEHADIGCLPTLLKMLEVGDQASIPAAIALARLGPPAAGDHLLRWIDRESPLLANWGASPTSLKLASIYAVGLAGRRDDARALLALRLKTHVRDAAVSAVALLQHPDNVRAIGAALRMGDPHRRRFACLVAGVQGDPRLLVGLREVYERSFDDDRLRLHAALGIALIDPDEVDDEVAHSMNRGWLHEHFEISVDDALAKSFALYALGRRLRERARVEGPLAAVAASLRAALEAIRPAEVAALRGYRGRSNGSSNWDKWVFVIGDKLEAARADLAALLKS